MDTIYEIFDRDETEQFLVEDDYQYIMQTDSGLELLRDLLLIGWKATVITRMQNWLQNLNNENKWRISSIILILRY